MACREGHNSVIVSLAYFITRSPGRNSRSDDALVKKAFHALRAEATLQHRTGAQIALSDPDLPADLRHQLQQLGDKFPPASSRAVLAFLEDQKSLARHDSRIPDRKRDLLLRKLDAAADDVRSGEFIPNTVVFHAWMNLQSRVEQMQATGSTTRGVTDPYGRTVTRADVEAAIAARDAAVTALEQASQDRRAQHMLGTHAQRLEALRTQVLVAEAALHATILTFDTTDDGYHALIRESEAFSDYIPVPASERQRIARQDRQVVVTASAEEVREYGARFRLLEREYLRAQSVGDEEAVHRLSEQFAHARLDYSRCLLLSAPLHPALDDEVSWECSIDPWLTVAEDAEPFGATRREKWLAMETYAAVRDGRLVQAGTLSADQAQARADARQNCRIEASRRNSATSY